jgi:hypothetical protein
MQVVPEPERSSILLGLREYYEDERDGFPALAKEHHLSDAKGGNWEEWPEELCIRDYPVSPSGKA